jgi:transcriptional regulator with XRE-family HTH domain
MVALAVNVRSLPSHQRSPFAQKVLDWLWGHNPPMSLSQLARQLGVSPQALSAWINAKSEPKPDHVKNLAKILGCKAGELQQSIELSRGWVAPMELNDFVDRVIEVSEKENWPYREGIVEYLNIARAKMWQDQDSVWAVMARDIVSQSLPLQVKATRIAYHVSAWLDWKSDPKLPS